uniref:Four helix bundle protein n=1 Tax=Prevotella sp. GTC17259 TaxID=3236795 RepID=A0AB33J4E7_9BACT
MSESIVRQKAEDFSVKTYRLNQRLRLANEFVLANQILKSGTSICANLYEAKFAHSTADYISKLTISLKEASETCFWLNLLHRVELIDGSYYKELHQDTHEIISILVAIIKRLKQIESTQ